MVQEHWLFTKCSTYTGTLMKHKITVIMDKIPSTPFRDNIIINAESLLAIPFGDNDCAPEHTILATSLVHSQPQFHAETNLSLSHLE